MGYRPISPLALFSKLKHLRGGVSLDRAHTGLSALLVEMQFARILPSLGRALVVAIASHAISLYGAATITPSVLNLHATWNLVAHALSTFSGVACVTAAVSVIFFWAGACLTVVFFSLAHNLALKTGLVSAVDTLTSLEPSAAGGLFSKIFPGRDYVLSADKDLDLFSSTDFEDLLVFTLDALELVWQDVNLVVDLCGDNLFALGVGVFATGSAFLLYRKAFSLKKVKR